MAADVLEFLAHHTGDQMVVRISDGEWGLSARTIARLLSSVSGLYAYLVARGVAKFSVFDGDIRLADRRLFIFEGKGGHQRVIPISNSFLAAVGVVEPWIPRPESDREWPELSVRALQLVRDPRPPRCPAHHSQG